MKLMERVFLELTESDVQKLVKPLGVVKLINSLQIQVKFSYMYAFFFCFILKYK